MRCRFTITFPTMIILSTLFSARVNYGTANPTPPHFNLRVLLATSNYFPPTFHSLSRSPPLQLLPTATAAAMQPPAVKIVLQNILSSKNPSLEFPQPVLQVTNASLVYSDTNHQLKDYTTTPTPTQHEPRKAKAKSAAKLRLSDTAYWTHGITFPLSPLYSAQVNLWITISPPPGQETSRPRL